MNFDKDFVNLEEKQGLNEKYAKAITRIKEVSYSYITKEKFIEMISSLDFKFIESARLGFITGFKYNEEKDEVKTIGFDISIDRINYNIKVNTL